MCAECKRCDASFVLVSPDGRTQRLADTKANTDSDANDEEYQKNLGDDTVSGTEAGHTVTTSASLGRLGLLLPMVFAGPDLTIAFPS